MGFAAFVASKWGKLCNRFPDLAFISRYSCRCYIVGHCECHISLGTLNRLKEKNKDECENVVFQSTAESLLEIDRWKLKRGELTAVSTNGGDTRSGLKNSWKFLEARRLE